LNCGAGTQTGCGLWNGAVHGAACVGAYTYQGQSYTRGCERLPGFAEFVCPTAVDYSSANLTFDPNEHPHGECECPGRRVRKSSGYPFEDKIKEAAPYKYHRVGEGESWAAIARANDLDLAQLLRYNGLRSENVQPQCAAGDCVELVAGTHLAVSRAEAVLPECQCQVDGSFSTVTADMMSCKDERGGVTTTPRFCGAAHPPGFVTTDDNDQYWQVEMNKDAPAMLSVDFPVRHPAMPPPPPHTPAPAPSCGLPAVAMPHTDSS